MKPPFGKRRREELAEEIEGYPRMSASDRIERGESPDEAKAAAQSRKEIHRSGEG